MAASPADTAFGLTITMASSFFAKIRVVNVSGISRAAIDTTHAGSSNGDATHIPSDIVDWGTIQIEGLLDHNTEPPIDDAPENVTITFPLATGETGAATWAVSGFLTDYNSGLPYNDVATFTATVKCTGPITFTSAT